MRIQDWLRSDSGNRSSTQKILRSLKLKPVLACPSNRHGALDLLTSATGGPGAALWHHGAASISLIGNTLLERPQEFGHFEVMLHQKLPELHLVIRHLAYSGDEIGVPPRPANFANTEQHLAHEKIDVIFAAVGFNESFAGEEAADTFRTQLFTWLTSLKTRAFNGKLAPRIV
jgi:hypothetical protein